MLTVWTALNNASPVDRVASSELRDDDKAGKPPKVVQQINTWLGVPKNSKILEDILDIASNAKLAKQNKNRINAANSVINANSNSIASNEDAISDNADSISDNADSISDNTDDIATNTGDIAVIDFDTIQVRNVSRGYFLYIFRKILVKD